MSLVYKAIAVVHPMGEFYLTAISARVLLETTFSDVYTCLDDAYVGHQRKLDPKRVAGIRKFIESAEAVFPGTIILAANCKARGGMLPVGDRRSWRIANADGSSGVVDLIIPTNETAAAIVDGQHRLGGFVGASEKELDMMLPCAVFIGLPASLQATVFATINYNQRPVSKSMTYELFGCSIDDADVMRWPPEKLAVFLTRRLNADEGSPLYRHIKIAAVDGRLAMRYANVGNDGWVVSTAMVVEGILALISSNPRADRDFMLKRSWFETRNRTMLDASERLTRNAPLRMCYINGKEDGFIYTVLKNYFTAVKKVFWDDPNSSVMHKAAGMQALFKVLKRILPRFLTVLNDVSVTAWERELQKAKALDLSNKFFTESSGKGSGRIRNALLVMMGMSSLPSEHEVVRGVCGGSLLRS